PLGPHPKVRPPFDLHVLGTPPAFVLSQDQTLSLISRPKGRAPAHDITARPTPGPHTRPGDPLKRRRFGRRAARQGPLPPKEKPPGRPRAAKPANLRRMPEPKAAPKPPPTHPFLFHHAVQRATGTKARATTWPRTPRAPTRSTRTKPHPRAGSAIQA